MSGRILVVGAGAIGGWFGAHMVRASLPVTLIDAWPAHVEYVRAHGLRVESIGGEAVVAHPDILHVGEVQALARAAPATIAFIAVKSYDTRWATELILSCLAPDGIVVSLQNAINEPDIAAIAGGKRTYGCAIAALACELVGPGTVRRMSPEGLVNVGAFEGADAALRSAIVRTLSHGERAAPIDDLIGVKWSKLVINAMRNGLSAMTGMTGRERDSNPETIKLGIRLGAQTVRVGRALGHRLVDTGFRFDDLLLADGGDAAACRRIEARMTEIANGRASEQRPSMAQDIRKGRRTETDAINGYVARLGREVGVETQAHQLVHERILQIERGLLQPSPELVHGIL